jgi:hypothetical protein
VVALGTRRRSVEALRLAALAGVILLLWFAIYQRFPGKEWAPIAYGGGDEAYIYAAVKAVQDGEIGLFGSKHVHRLGAPFGANWNDFPSTEDFLYFLTGQLARVTGVIAAVDAAYLGAILLAAMSFYLVGRYMRWRWVFCFAGAVLYGWSYYMTHRSVSHFNLIFYWPCPFWLLVCWWTAGRGGIVFGEKKFWFSVAVVFFTAWNNPYYASMFLQLLGLAAIAHLVRRYPVRSLAAPLALALLCVGLVLVTLLDTLMYWAKAGLNTSAVVRNFSDVERYSLRPLDLFLPYFHRLKSIQAMVRDYAADSLINGEIAMTYLGLIGCIALLWLMGATFYHIIAGSKKERPSGLGLQSLWVLFYAVCGGISMLPALFGLYLLRANNRMSIVLLTLALFFVVRQCSRSRWVASRSRVSVFVATVLVVAVGLWDQTPVHAAQDVNAIRSRMKTDRLFVQRLERDLPKGAMVFQLPVLRAQEGGRVYRMPPYDQFRPYIFSRSLRFSHGEDFGRAREEWRMAVGRLRPANMVSQLEAHGFDGILLNRDAYRDGGNALISSIRQSGREPDWRRDHKTFLFIRLNPAQPPRAPSLPPLFAKGWYERETDGTDIWCWSKADAELEFHRPGGQTARSDVAFDLQAVTPRTVRVMSEGQLLNEVVVASARTDQRVSISINWRDGEEKRVVELKSNAAPFYDQYGDRRALGIRVSNLDQTPSVFPD